MQEILTDLKAEQEALDRFLSTLAEIQWDLPSPAEGWSVRDCVSHIAHIDEVALALLEGDNTPLEVAAKVKFGFTEIGPQKGRAMKPSAILPWWRTGRAGMWGQLSTAEPQAGVLCV